MKTKLIAIIWGLLVATGGWAIFAYSNRPGPVGDVPKLWPLTATLERGEGKPSLIMFAHPRCSCSRASLNELDRILARVGGRAKVQVVFYRPSKFDRNWVKSDLWNKVAEMSNVHAFVDVDGVEAKKFGAMTSGHVVLYGDDDELLFSGGITDSRAHEGDNLGRSTIIDILHGKSVDTRITQTFGCTLFHDGGAAGIVVGDKASGHSHGRSTSHEGGEHEH